MQSSFPGVVPCSLVHSYTPEDARTLRALADMSLDRLAIEAPLDWPRTPEELATEAGETVTSKGIGPDEALRLWREVLGPACLSVDHRRYLSNLPPGPARRSSRRRHRVIRPSRG